MVNNSGLSRDLSVTFGALSDPTRRAIPARLASGEATVSELGEPFEMSGPAISKHLKMLERAGLISRGRDAQRRPCRIEAKPLAEASSWLEGYRRAGRLSAEDARILAASRRGNAPAMALMVAAWSWTSDAVPEETARTAEILAAAGWHVAVVTASARSRPARI